jgi:hypothetical protein
LSRENSQENMVFAVNNTCEKYCCLKSAPAESGFSAREFDDRVVKGLRRGVNQI